MHPAAGRILTELQRALTAPEPLEALAALTQLRGALDAYEHEQVRRALRQGESFAAIAREVGISRQAAHRRYRGLTTAEPVYTPRMLRVLQLARGEAARMHAEFVEVEHVARVLAGRARPLSAGIGPTRVGPELRALLRELERPIEVEDLRRAIHAAAAA
ncbi:hypothetical protein OJ997_17345 [Solirubrobacter phytolaccae]|uniref:Uncharacterized protein n=1 Tax=Solirubrobacter phytolaccae TaxID=1404360 RepID=A0A9X3S8E2_9ACTN|nr:hypothetical protein [Solirubrobacter phytolaccae]MDA0182074.1 hypothetical protein [Solirubrobacter phytolaccae]